MSDLTGPGFEPQTSRLDSTVLNNGFSLSNSFLYGVNNLRRFCNFMSVALRIFANQGRIKAGADGAAAPGPPKK